MYDLLQQRVEVTEICTTLASFFQANRTNDATYFVTKKSMFDEIPAILVRLLPRGSPLFDGTYSFYSIYNMIIDQIFRGHYQAFCL